MRYVALLRGIGPTNPNMRAERLKSVFEEIGFNNVHPVIASGNVIFDSSSKNSKSLEEKIEKALPKKLGFNSTTIIRGKEELEALIKKNPFKGVRDEKPNYLLVTFFKNRRPELCTVIKLAKGKIPDFMSKIESDWSAEILGRNTHARIRSFGSTCTPASGVSPRRELHKSIQTRDKFFTLGSETSL